MKLKKSWGWRLQRAIFLACGRSSLFRHFRAVFSMAEAQADTAVKILEGKINRTLIHISSEHEETDMIEYRT